MDNKVENEFTEDVVDAAKEKPKARKKPIQAKEIDIHQFISVRNGYKGALVYVSKRTGEYFKWDNFGDVQDMELLELKNAKSQQKRFFEQNWFLFDEPWVIDYLGVGQYYKNALNLNDFDDIFELPPDEMTERISLLQDGQKRAVAYRAHELIESGEIDSHKTILALEKELGITLINQ